MFDECLYFNTAALSRALEREWAVAFRPFDLAPPQAFMLRAIVKTPGLLQSELASALAISRPTATRCLDGLETKGFIIRQRMGIDGRQISIHPTEQATHIVPAINAASAKVTARLKKQLGEANFTTSVEGIRAIRSTLK